MSSSAASGMALRMFTIPAGDGEQPIVVASNELPEIADELAEVLITVHAHLGLWLDFIAEYGRQGRFQQMEKLLEYTTKKEILHVVTDAAHTEDRLRLYCLQGSYELRHGNSARKGAGAPSSDDMMARIKQASAWTGHMSVVAKSAASQPKFSGVAPLQNLFAASVELSKYSNLTAVHAAAAGGAAGGVGAGVGLSGTDTPASALAQFTTLIRDSGVALSRGGRPAHYGARIPLLMGEALVSWHEGDWVKAREKYAECVMKHPGCGAGPRLGLALCLYKLGHVEASKAACKRALQLDGTCTTALALLAFLEGNGRAINVAAGLVDEATNDPDAQAQAVARGAALAKRAVQFSPDCSQAVHELAHHTFGAWVDATSPATGAPLTASVLRGSRALVLSEGSADLLSGFRAGETVKVMTVSKGGALMVPFRLARSVGSLASVRELGEAAPAGLSPDTLLCVLHTRAPWGLPSATGCALKVVDLDGALKQARQAVAAARSEGGRAAALYGLAKALHARGDLVDAGVQYRACLRLDPGHTPAMTGLAQAEAWKGSGGGEEEAVKILTKVTDLRPDDRTALKLLAALRLRQGRMDEALEHAKRACDLAPWDSSAQALYSTLGQRAEGRDGVERALRAAEHAAKRLRERGNAVPAALLNNVGVLRCRMALLKSGSPAERDAELKTADDFFGRALSQLASESAPGASAESCSTASARDAAMLMPGQGVSIAFNIARLREMQGRGGDAGVLYARIVDAAPSYTDAQLRLAGLARSSGDSAGARVRYEAVLASARASVAAAFASAGDGSGGRGAATPGSASRSTIVAVLLSLGQLAEGRGDNAGARALYTAALAEPGFEKDPFAALSLANLDFSTLYDLQEYGGQGVREGASGDKDVILRIAFDRYKDVLKRHPANAYAANGLGCVLAEQDRLDHAKEVFCLVREAAPGAMPAALNLAHTMTALGSTDTGAQMYGHVLKRFGGGRGTGSSGAGGSGAGSVDAAVAAGATGGHGGPAEQAKVLLHVARAHVLTEKYGDALRPLARALVLTPTDSRLLFDLSLVQLQQALLIAGGYQKQAVREEKGEPTPLGSRIAAEQLATCITYLYAGRSGLQTVLARLNELQEEVTRAETAVAQAQAEAGESMTDDSGATPLAAAQMALVAARANFWEPRIKIQKVQELLATIELQKYISQVEFFYGRAKMEAARATAEAARRLEELSARAAERNATESTLREAAEAKRASERAQAAALQLYLVNKQGDWAATDAKLAADKGKKKSGKGSKASGDSDTDDDEAGGPGAGAAGMDVEGQMRELFGEDSDVEPDGEYKPPASAGRVGDASSSSSDDSSSGSDSDSEDSDSGSSSSSGGEGRKNGKKPANLAANGKGKGKKKDTGKEKPAERIPASAPTGSAPGTSSSGSALKAAPSEDATEATADAMFDELFGDEEGSGAVAAAVSPQATAGAKRLRHTIEDSDEEDVAPRQSVVLKGTDSEGLQGGSTSKRGGRAVIEDDEDEGGPAEAKRVRTE